MRLVLVCNFFPPQRNSAAVQLRDLSIELVQQGHDVTVLVAAQRLSGAMTAEELSGVRIVRVSVPGSPEEGMFRRAISECLMPLVMWWRLRRSVIWAERWDGVIWYSPTIFLGLVASALKSLSKCKAYLIIRDIFPDWARDLGLMGGGPAYWFFRRVAAYQYGVADFIGVQSPGNRVYFEKWLERPGRRLQVLHNWLADAPVGGCSIDIGASRLSGRRIFVYAGNIGVAQGMNVLVELADRMSERTDVGFVFVGRGSAYAALRDEVARRGLDNVACFDEIGPDEIPGLYAQCHVGLVALDIRHRTHNVPGKFLSYMQFGLPVLASVNPGNDLVALIRRENVGHVCTSGLPDELAALAVRLLDDLRVEPYAVRCKALASRLFSAEGAGRQVAFALMGWGGA